MRHGDASQIQIIGIAICRSAAGFHRPTSHAQRRYQFLPDFSRHLVPQCNQVIRRRPERAGPDQLVVFHFHRFQRDHHRLVLPKKMSRYHGAHAQFTPGFCRIRFCVGVLLGRRRGPYFQRMRIGQRIRDLIRQRKSQELALGIVVDVLQRQHRDCPVPRFHRWRPVVEPPGSHRHHYCQQRRHQSKQDPVQPRTWLLKRLRHHVQPGRLTKSAPQGRLRSFLHLHQVGFHLRRVLVALAAVLLHCSPDDGFEFHWHLRIDQPRRGRLRIDHRM